MSALADWVTAYARPFQVFECPVRTSQQVPFPCPAAYSSPTRNEIFVLTLYVAISLFFTIAWKSLT